MTDLESRPTNVTSKLDEKHSSPEISNANDDSADKPDDQQTDKVTTVFHDPINYNVKHPLQNTWKLWFDNPGKKASAASWSQNLKEIVSIDTVEDFWGVYNNIVKVNYLDISSNYHFFKKGIRPEWEDPANADGAKFSIQYPRNRTGDAINTYWLFLLLAMIGEQFAYENEICGAVVSVRKIFFRVALWVRSSDRNEITETLGRQIREFLSIPTNMAVEFTPHGDAPAKSDQKFTI